MARSAGVRNVSNGILFDTVELPAAGLTKASFFNTRTRANGFHLTNMKIAGMLPAPESFTVRSVRFYVVPSGAVTLAGVAIVPPAAHVLLTDVMKAIHGGALYLEVGSKPYIDYWPLDMISGGNSYENGGGDAAAGVSIKYAGSGLPNSVIQLRHPVKINTQEPFRAEIVWAVANVVSIVQSLRVTLGGDYVRAVE